MAETELDREGRGKLLLVGRDGREGLGNVELRVSVNIDREN